MRHVKISELDSTEVTALADDGTVSIDRLSRDLALAAADGDERARLLRAMQMLGNIRDFLVAAQSAEAEQLLDLAIQQLMQRERALPARWRGT